jgi:hypothetical protein
MILNNAGRRCFDGAILDDSGKPLDAAHSLDYMMLEYAKVRRGGESSTVAISREVIEPTSYPLPRCDDCEQLLAALEGVLPFLTGNYWPGVEADAAVDRAIATARKVGAGRTAPEGHNIK